MYLQIMINAVKMVADCYEGDKYGGHGISVHKVPRDTVRTGYDAYPPENASYEREALANPKLTMNIRLGAEFQELMAHLRSSMYRVEFSKCSEATCRICSANPIQPSELSNLLDRFPKGMLPTPMPVLRDDGSYPILSTLMRSGQADPVVPLRTQEDLRQDPDDGEQRGSNRVDAVSDFVRAKTGRYRTLFELSKTVLPSRCFFSDSHYYGKTVKFHCLTCDSFVTVKSDAALQRHKKLVHCWRFDAENGGE